ncbi:ExeA family protein [Elioraea rosea]|uniref:ExeA family protein n=1 Tax=Elioraea rosea TaxID=2492390 RepID=UPI001186CDD2|nr:AAA family ATPase [Elioraea rosea]
MYAAFYGFHDHPFLMTPDARLFYASSVHSRAHAHLVYGLEQREGFVIVTGEVGAGKTTLIDRLCAELDPTAFAVARIMTTQVSGDDLLRLVADGFGVPSDGNKAQLLRGITEMLRGGDEVGRRHVLIVDEAQALPMPALEELRMLSNITEGGRALLQVILLGQPQLRRTIASPDLDQLRQRVLASYHLGGLSREETHAYIEHRLRAVGWTGNPHWHAAALDMVHRYSGGIPRRINRLASRVLLGAALEQASEITAQAVEITARELEEDLSGGVVPGTPMGVGPAMSANAAAAAHGYMLSHGGTNGYSLADDPRLSELSHRIEALERVSARRERVFNRLMDLFASNGGRGP